MKDPFFIPPIAALEDWVRPYAQQYHMTVLPQHIHEVIAATLLYTFIHLVISPWLSNKYATAYYPTDKGKKASWDSHVVSLFQSTLICIVALYMMWTDNERASMDWQGRIWGYTGASGLVQSLTAGYFVWDLCITITNLKVFGLGLLAHAFSALTVYSFGYRPFLNYYASVFILYELSTPFLNIHWFFDKLGMTGTKAQLYNGIILLTTFFSARLIWGVGQSVMVWYDMYRAIFIGPNAEYMSITPVSNEKLPGTEDIMMYAKEAGPVPIWLAAVYLFSNITLNTLNFIWFGKMIKAVRKRFEPGTNKTQTETKKLKVPLPTGSATGKDLAEKIEELRQRHNIPAGVDITITGDLAEVQ